MGLTLYKVDSSPPARAVLMMLELLKVPDVTYQDINILAGENIKEEFLKLNPQHTLPTLVDGDFVIWDSHAIAAYLVTQYAANDSLYPKDAKKRALVDQRLHFDTGVLFPSISIIIRTIYYKGETSIRPEFLDNVYSGYGFLETFLEGSSWVAGDSLTIADVCCGATVSSMNEIVPVNADKYPNITRWLEQLSKEDFYIKKNIPGCTRLGVFVRSQLA